MSRFGFITDLHLTGKNISSRTDNYQETVLDKIKQCYQYAKKQNFDFMLNGGDTFDFHKIYSYEILLKLREIMLDFGKPTYFIVGNHDVYGLSFNYYDKSTLNFMSKICDLFIPIMDNIVLDDIILAPCHTWNAPDYCVKNGESYSDKYQILIMHHLLDKTGSKSKGSVYDTSAFGELNFDLVLSGDLHDGYDLHSFGKTTYYNPGSLARTSRDHANRLPKMAVFDLDRNGDKFVLQKNDFLPDVISGSVLFKEELFTGIDEIEYNEIEIATEDTQQLIDEFKSMKLKSSDIFSLISNFAIKEGTPKSVLEHIYTFKKNTV